MVVFGTRVNSSNAPYGLWHCMNWPALFPGQMSYKATKPGLVSVLYLCIRFTVLGPLFMYHLFSLLCSVFWLFWLSYQYLPSDWLERPLWRSLIVARGSSPRKPRQKSAYDFLGLLYCFIVLLCICVVSCPYMIYCSTVMARYSLFVLKVPLNPKQANKQTNNVVDTNIKVVQVKGGLEQIHWMKGFLLNH